MGEPSSSYTEFVVKIVPGREITPPALAVAEGGDEAAPANQSTPLDPAPLQKVAEGSDKAAPAAVTFKVYDALIYTNAGLPETPKLETPCGERPADWPESVAGLPLAGVEQVKIHWDRYRAYLFAFFFGEKRARTELRNLFKPGDASPERPPLFEIAAGSFLEGLLRGQLFTDQPVRVWWSSDAQDLICLPWELMLHVGQRDAGRPLSFVRGLPPAEAVVKIPLAKDKPLKLAFIYEPQTAPDALLAALDSLKKGVERKKHGRVQIEVELMTAPAREALQQAVSKGCEVVHIVTDGDLSLANEGVLYFRKSGKVDEDNEEARNRRTNRGLLTLLSSIGRRLLPKSVYGSLSGSLEAKLEIDRCPPDELSSALSGSRVGLLCLSAVSITGTSFFSLNSYRLPKVYRAFAALGSSALPLPSIVAPSGATDEAQAIKFWHDFYTSLAKTAEPEPAMAKGLEGKPDLPMALFLRQRDGRPFKPLAPGEQVTVEPTQLDAALQLSTDLVAQLVAQAEDYGEVPESIRNLLETERERQEHLKKELEPWR